MPLYLALNADGTRQRQSARDMADVDIGDGLRLVTLAQYDTAPDESAFTWDAATEDFVPIASASISRTVISKREFRNRLGQSVRLAILAVRRSTDPAHAMYRDLLEDMKETLDSVNEVDLQNPDTIAGVYGLAQLAQAGLLPALDPAAILAPSTVAQE